ncbi:hypothetical protein [Spirosoma rhododendri]|uniref:Uncharacterized protein n=1 Tax=Spirosoma rhododendri TaxID=2728024 RepID=A0A7L5DP74_9BACT|nr:hypothetical protein [Spirosoma rhododendri]QJD80294.1 hypothetical protein HH216_19100 [Spirosoma rhododendri]
MKSIDITNIWEDDDLMMLLFRASNGESSCRLEFYQDDGTLLEFARQLMSFPKSIEHVVQYETGNWERSGHYLLLEVSCVAPSGISAMRVVAKNFYEVPNAFEAQFYIKSEPASFNAFGKALANWKPKVDKKLAWQFY